MQVRVVTWVLVVHWYKKLNAAEKNYATIEKECYAIVWSVKKFDEYLIGAKFTVRSDHRPLQWLMTNKETKGRRLRWALILQNYNFRIEYIEGVENHVADVLSRIA